MKNLRVLNKYRDLEREKLVGISHYRRSLFGIFNIPLPTGEIARAIADNGLVDTEWEHVSVSTPYRCLTWDEMCFIKDLFFNDEVVIQIHPQKKNYVNFHPYTLHLWRPKTKSIPLPPPSAVL